MTGCPPLVGKRIHPDRFPETEPLPAIAYSLEDDRSAHTQQGASHLREAVYRFDVWADTVAEATAVIRQLRSALDGYRGSFKTSPWRECSSTAPAAPGTRTPKRSTFPCDSPFITRRFDLG